MAKRVSKQRRLINIQPPMGGVSRDVAYQQQPPFTCHDALNVIPIDVLERRIRIGSRPGINRHRFARVGPGPVNCLGVINHPRSDGMMMFEDDFSAPSLDASWVAPPFSADGAVQVDQSNGWAYASNGEERGAMFETPAPIILAPSANPGESRSVQLFVRPTYDDSAAQDATISGTYRLYVCLDTATPDPTQDGFMAELTIADDGSQSGFIRRTLSGVSNTVAISSAPGFKVDGSWIQLLFEKDQEGGRVRLFWQGRILAEQTSWQLTATTRRNCAFEIVGTNANAPCKVDLARIWYATEPGGMRANQIVGCAGGKFAYEIGMDRMVVATNDPVPSTERNLAFIPYQNRAYIMDHSAPRFESDLPTYGFGVEAVTTGTSGQLDFSTALSAAEVAAVDFSVDVCEIYDDRFVGGVETPIAGTYKISSLTTTRITLNLLGGAAFPAAEQVALRVCKGWMQWSPYTATRELVVNPVDDRGWSVPQMFRVAALWRERLVLGSPAWGPANWYASETGELTRFKITASDPSSAVGGVLPSEMTALIPISDDHLLMGCARAMYVMSGNPADGGQITDIGSEAGVLSAFSACRLPDGGVLVLGNAGLFTIGPGRGLEPLAVSNKTLPEELRNINPNNATVVMAYDIEMGGVWIFVTYNTARMGIHWFFDWANKGFWPIELPADIYEPTAIYSDIPYLSNSHESKPVILGCRDGYLRSMHRRNEMDDNNTMASYVDIGPMRLGQGGYDTARLSELVGTTDENSARMTWALRTGKTAQDAIGATSRSGGTWTAGLSHTARPGDRGESMMLKVTGTGRPWALEGILGRITSAGKRKPGA